MAKNCFLNYSKSFLVIITVFFSSCLFAQQNDVPVQLENQFWRNVQFGGGIGLGFGSGYTDISVAPSVKLDGSNSTSENYWNTALFIGAGYRSGNATIGARYNVLTDKNNIYGSAFMPFIRFYF
jgi:hypothetical protein